MNTNNNLYMRLIPNDEEHLKAIFGLGWEETYRYVAKKSITDDIDCIYALGTDDPSKRVVITDVMLPGYENSIEELHEAALSSQRKREPVIMPICSMIDSLCGFPESEEEDAGPPMLVITSGDKRYGAAYILDPELQRSLSDKFKGDYYVLPSSQHEVLAIPYDPKMEEYFSSMVKEINFKEVSPQDFLSDTILHYDSQSRTLEPVRDGGRDRDHGVTQTDPAKDDKSPHPGFLDVLSPQNSHPAPTTRKTGIDY